MRRARPGLRVPCFACAAAFVLLIAGCQSKPRGSSELTFERGGEVPGLTRGPALLREFEPYRMENGALRVRGKVDLPDGTRLQVAVKRKGEDTSVQMVQVLVDQGGFDSPPMVSDHGPLPVSEYRFEVLVHFTREWQDAHVMRATDDGRALRGPGVTRTKQGVASFFLVQEAKI